MTENHSFKKVVLLVLMVMPIGATATDMLMVNRSINLSQNINYIVSVNASVVPMSGVQITFNYDETALKVNWVRQGDFLYYASNDAKIWHVWNRNGSLMVASLVLFDMSVLQTKKSTLMTINMKPLRKGTTYVNLSGGILAPQGLDVGGMNKNYSISVR